MSFWEYANPRKFMGLTDRVRDHGRVEGLPPMLEELHDLLVRHFSHEQFPGGLYEQLGAYGPEHHGTIRELIGEHSISIFLEDHVFFFIDFGNHVDFVLKACTAARVDHHPQVLVVLWILLH